MLTTAYCQLNSDASRHEKEVIKRNSKGQALVKDVANLPEAGELHMTPDQWVDAWKTWLMLIELYQPHVAKAWHNHYALVFYNPSFHLDFNLWLCYDIMVRKRWIEEDFDPGSLQEGILKTVERDLAQAARESLTHNTLPNQSPYGTLRNSHHRSQPCDHFLTADQHHSLSDQKQNRFHPYKSAPGVHNQSNYSAPGTSGRCLQCGGTLQKPDLLGSAQEQYGVPLKLVQPPGCHNPLWEGLLPYISCPDIYRYIHAYPFI
jgi:hypothetical protein